MDRAWRIRHRSLERAAEQAHLLPTVLGTLNADIVLLVTRMNLGGPAQQVVTLANCIGERSPWKAVVAAGKPSVREGEVADPAVPVVPVPLVRPVRLVTDLRGLLAVRHLLARTGARLVHSHMAKAGALGRLAALSRAASRQERPKLVHTFHGHVLQGYFPSAQQQAFVRLERWLAKRTDVIIAVSPEVRDELLDLGVGKPAQYHVVPMGLDLSRLLQVGSPGGPRGRLRAALGLGQDVPLAGVLGRLVPIKDHSTLLRALRHVPGLHLAVLGDGELRASLEQQAQQLGVAERAHFTGWWHDVPAALADLDLVVLSSLSEGTPVALIEALAAGRPVVATDVGGVRHVVQDGDTGWLCPSGDARALAERLSLALADRERATQLAERGRRQAETRFGLERMLADHLAIYQELLSPAERRRPRMVGSQPTRGDVGGEPPCPAPR